MVGEIYHIYNIQITEKYICENSPLSWHDLIIILPFRTLPFPINLPKMFILHEKLFLEKCDHHTLVGWGGGLWIAYASKTKEKLGSRDF